jgi:AcrR family transcriptional regulator
LITPEDLFQEAMNLYYEYGGRFTMDELAARLGISKKTLYEMVHSKEELAVQLVEFYFSGVAKLQDEIHSSSDLNAVEKLHRLLCATPDYPMRKYHLKEMKQSFPAAYKVLDSKLRQGWERTLAVLNEAKKEGGIREIDNTLFSRIYAAAIEEILMENDIQEESSFRQKQEQLVDILLNGICK